MYDFVRISCIQEANFISMDYIKIHNSAVDKVLDPDFSTWGKNGYYSPKNLDYKCKLPKSEYRIATTQAGWGSGMCGAAPSINFSLYRNSELIIKNVIFGDSCLGNPSISRVSILDTSISHFPTEMEICYQENTNGEKSKEKCKWYFQQYEEKNNILPIDNNFISNALK